jgi:hypothetical protein
MANQYLTIVEAAQVKGVAPAAIHEALCTGALPVVLDFRSARDECRLVRRWELESWSPGDSGFGGGARPSWRRPGFTVLHNG